jgi:cyclophilin family peptidyl-prolyl cis-trans isomerase
VNTNWPVGETWRASFIFAVAIAASGVAHGDARARAATAFALGQLGVAWEPVAEGERARAETALLEALAVERDGVVRDRIVEALGKVGGERALATLDHVLDGDLRARGAIALAALAKKGLHVPAATRLKLEAQLRTGDAAARHGAALALWRMRDPASRAALLAGLGDRAVHVRGACAQALGEIGGDAEVGALARLVDGDNDGRVAAEAARALVNIAMRCPAEACPAREALARTRGPWRPPVMQAVAFEKWRHPRAVALLRVRFAEYATAPLDARTRALVSCKAALAHDRARGQIELLRGCGAGVVDEAHRGVLMAQALAAVGGTELAALTTSKYAAVRAAAAEGADAATTRVLLADADALVVEAAAERAGELGLTDAGALFTAALARLYGVDSLEAQQALLAAAAKLHLTAMAAPARARLDAEPYALRQEAAHALTILDGKPVTARLPLPPRAPAPTLPLTVVRLETSRGRIRVRLYVDDAPRTASNFVQLVRRRFYDGLTFHRVVPDFVSQGGDPRGDGSGGPGYMIPCEINPRRYGEGVMGMALAGRDTGGSQFFFTHAPTPHLDGRYTAFGEIVEGLDVAINLVEGDIIVSARVE